MANAGEHDHEFITTQARYGVSLAEAGGQSYRDFLQQLIADHMAERIVDRFESIEIQEEHGEHFFIAVSARKRLRKAIMKQQPVGKPGKRIMVCLVANGFF